MKKSSEQETLPIARWKHSKQIASLHKGLHDFQLFWLEIGIAQLLCCMHSRPSLLLVPLQARPTTVYSARPWSIDKLRGSTVYAVCTSVFRNQVLFALLQSDCTALFRAAGNIGLRPDSRACALGCGLNSPDQEAATVGPTSLGERFWSYAELEEKLKRYEELTCKRDSRTMEAARRRMNRPLADCVAYYEITYRCIHGGGSLKHEGKASVQLCNVLRSPDSTAAINTSRSAIALYHSPTDFLLSFSGHFGKTALLSLLCGPWMMVWLWLWTINCL